LRRAVLILRIWKNVPGKFFCISTKSRSGDWKDHFFRRSQLKTVPAFIKDNLDKDLYWCPHGFRKPRRLKEYAEIPKLLWGDLDECDPRTLGDLLPTVAWESSPGRYCGLWILDKYMTENLNRRLTYHIGADKGGWDLTQVLRIPNTRNYKYTSTPRVKLLWSDGSTFTIEQLEELVPEEKKLGRKLSSAARIYKKYEHALPGWVRRTILKGKPTKGKRSQVMWRLTHELVEAGLSKDEAFELLRASPWNKFRTRRDGDEQLKRELNKSLTQHFRVEDDESGEEMPSELTEGEEIEFEDESYKFLAHSMQDVEDEEMDWIWYPYLARGELTILEGDPGLGKSYLAQMIGGAICDGKRLPHSRKKFPPVEGRVAYFDIENASGSVTKKRLTLNGVKNLHNFYQEEEPFSIDNDDIIDRVYEAIEHLKPTLVVFDTINTYMGRSDSHKATETQWVFKRFVDIARRYNCAVLVLRHLTKSSKEKALYRGQGSIAFAGLARIVMTVGVVPDEDEVEDIRALAVTKINVTRPPKTLTFTIEELPDTLKQSDRSRFVWGKYVDLTSDQIITGPTNGHSTKSEVVKEAEKLLAELLEEGQVSLRRILRAGEARSVSASAISKAANEMGVLKKGKGVNELWSLPRAPAN